MSGTLRKTVKYYVFEWNTWADATVSVSVEWAHTIRSCKGFRVCSGEVRRRGGLPEVVGVCLPGVCVCEWGEFSDCQWCTAMQVKQCRMMRDREGQEGWEGGTSWCRRRDCEYRWETRGKQVKFWRQGGFSSPITVPSLSPLPRSHFHSVFPQRATWRWEAMTFRCDLKEEKEDRWGATFSREQWRQDWDIVVGRGNRMKMPRLKNESTIEKVKNDTSQAA